MTCYWDIETGPASDDVLAIVKPEFKASRVLKDPEKIKADIIAKEQAWMDTVALDAKTGVVLAIGIVDADCTRFITGPEPALLEAWWKEWNAGERMVGFCVKNFDMPFLVQRSWIQGVTVPTDLMEGRYWNRRLVDLQELWVCYGRDTSGQSLDSICKACGLPGKLPGMTGADFARVYAEDRNRALAYLQADLNAVAALAGRLGIS